jgi:putative DNA primase/helicase
MLDSTRIQDKARGRWKDLLPRLGVPARHLANKHGPCPICGGRDRFRWDDKRGEGTYFCSNPNCGPGTGVDLVMKVNGVDFVGARTLIETQLPGAKFSMSSSNSNDRNTAGAKLWPFGLPLNEYDAAARYLAKRGLAFPGGYPTQLRFLARASYKHEDGSRTDHPAMMAHMVGPDGAASTVHITYLTPEGEKADVPMVRKLAPGKVPDGGAVRLAATNGGDTLGIAEGIETALAAMQLFDVPVWATLNAGNLLKWEPPAHVRNVLIFGDNDAHKLFTGQAAAFALAAKLAAAGVNVDVRIPDLKGHDWADMLAGGHEPGDFACAA